MGNEEEEIAAYQRKQDENPSEGDEDNSEDFGLSDDDDADDSDEDVKLLNVEALRQRDDLTDKQKQMLSKIEGIRRQLKKLLDKRAKLKN